MPAPPQTLLLDADDTLWENNVYFERAIAAFISFLNHQTHTPGDVRDVLNENLTWMVGNSPRSDVNPALAAGLNAVFVPHADTWVLEHEQVGVEGARGTLLTVGCFAELREHF